MNLTGTPFQLNINQDLYLRKATPHDAAALYQIIDSERTYLREWLPCIDKTTHVSATELYIQSITIMNAATDLLFVMVYQETIAGLISFKSIDNYNKKLEIGYWLSEKLQGKGIVQRSCKTLISYAFEQMGMNRIQIKVGVGNYKSSNIPKKLNFTLEGIQREGELLNGKYHDLEVYSLLRRDG